MTPDGPEIVLTFLEARHWSIIDTWDTVGLRATGSHDVEVVDVFVPAHRTFPLPLPDPVSDGALFRFPLVGLFSIGLAACALGVAQAAIDDVLGLAGTKTPFGPAATTLASRTTAQLAVCEAMALVRSVRALLHEETTVLWNQVRSGPLATAEQRASLRLAATHATIAVRQGRRPHVHHCRQHVGLRIEPAPAAAPRRPRHHAALLRRPSHLRDDRQGRARRRTRRLHALTVPMRGPKLSGR